LRRRERGRVWEGEGQERREGREGGREGRTEGGRAERTLSQCPSPIQVSLQPGAHSGTDQDRYTWGLVIEREGGKERGRVRF